MSSIGYSCQILVKHGFSVHILKNNQIPNFMKIRPVGAELLHADGQTDRHEEADSRFSQFCEHGQKNLKQQIKELVLRK